MTAMTPNCYMKRSTRSSRIADLPDLFLEFTNRQIRRYYGLYDLPEDRHEQIVSSWTNVAAWLCEDHCLLPVGFLTECPILRRVAAGKRALFDLGLVQIPMRGSSLTAFVDRRRDAYLPYRDDFGDLYDDDGDFILKTSTVAFKDKRVRTRPRAWSTGGRLAPTDPSSGRRSSGSGPVRSRVCQKFRDRLNRNEAGVVWNGVSAMFEETDRRYEDDLQRILQAEYVEILLRRIQHRHCP